MIEFKPFDKIPRLKRTVIVTEKIDGTNAQILIVPRDLPYNLVGALDIWKDEFGVEWGMYAGSRNRYIAPEDDNYGFAGWVKNNAADLRSLGEGQHFGEWWGVGIGRNYGMTSRKFSLFNVQRWNKDNPNRPACCDVVPTLAIGEFNAVEESLAALKANGSFAMPGYMNPEGVIVYHSAARSYFKVTIERDDEWKGQKQKEAA
jgi:hypothetical protein